MKSKRKSLFLAIAVFTILSMSNFGAVQVSAAKKGVLKGAIHWGISADWVDPSISGFMQSSHLTLYMFHDSLIKPMPEGMYTPCLAESWTISPDYKVYEFKIRKGVKFHNGDEMTAEDVLFTFNRYKGGGSKFLKSKFQKLEVVNPYLFRVTFKEPFPKFLDYFLPGLSTIGWVVPKKYIEEVGDAKYKRHPIGLGPFKFVEFKPGVRLIGEAHEDFWRRKPGVKRLEFHFVKEMATRYAKVKTGEVDFSTLMVDVFFEKVKKDDKLKMITPMSPTTWVLYMAAQWDPKSPWSNPLVRKAASLAIDRQTLADIHCPGAGPLGQLGPGDPETLSNPPDPYDPEQAKKLMAQAGYPNGFDGGTFYPFPGGYLRYSEQVANYLAVIGIKTRTVLLDRPSFYAKRRGGKMKGALFIDPSPAPTINARLSYLFGPKGSYGNYPEIEALWKEYTKAVDAESAKDLIVKIQKIIYDKYMFVPITGATSPAAYNKRVKGNPYHIQKPYPLWFVSPMENLELDE